MLLGQLRRLLQQRFDRLQPDLCAAGCRRAAPAGVTCEITPRLPSDTRAAASHSGWRWASISTTSPFGLTMRSPTTSSCRAGKVAPVPWVPVEMAPAMVWYVHVGLIA